MRRSFGASGARLRRAKGARSKPARARYRVGYIASIAPIVQRWTGHAGFDGAAFSGHTLRRGAMWSRVAARVHIACLKQFSGHASLKSLEEYAKLEVASKPSVKGCPTDPSAPVQRSGLSRILCWQAGKGRAGGSGARRDREKGPALARGSPYSYHVKSASEAHLPNPPHIGEGCVLNGSGHTSHEKTLLRDVLIPSLWKIRGADVWRVRRQVSCVREKAGGRDRD